jgi:arabinose-5-phosphate isomerase
MNKKNYKNYFDSYIKSIESDIQNLKQSYPTDFDKVIELILNSKGRLVFSGIGKSGQIAKKISSSIASTGTHSFFIHPSEAVHGDLGMIHKDDIVFAISNSGNTKELYGIIDYCKNLSIDIVSITSNPDSYLAQNSNYTLLIPKVDEFSNLGSPCNSIILTLIMADALMIALHSEKNFTKEEYKSLHPSGNIGKNLMKVSDVMIKDFPVATMESDITDILIDMSSKKLDFCVVIDSDKKLVGILEVGKIAGELNAKSSEYKLKKNAISDDLIAYDFDIINHDALVLEVKQLTQKESDKKNIAVVDENNHIVGVLTKDVI